MSRKGGAGNISAGASKTRGERKELTKRAAADVMQARIVGKKCRKTAVARQAGISRTHLRSLLRAEQVMSVFVFLELSDALSVDDPCQLLGDVIKQRDELTRT
jgi:hypothetical protein